MLEENVQLKNRNVREGETVSTLTMKEWGSLITVEQLSSDLDSLIRNFYQRK